MEKVQIKGTVREQMTPSTISNDKKVQVVRAIYALLILFGVSTEKAESLDIKFPIQLYIDEFGKKYAGFEGHAFATFIRSHLMKETGESFRVDGCDSLWDILHNNGLN